MANYQIGDVIIFDSMPETQWLLVEIKEKVYEFVNLWDHKKAWTSQKKAPVHNDVIKHYRGGSEVKDES